MSRWRWPALIAAAVLTVVTVAGCSAMGSAPSTPVSVPASPPLAPGRAPRPSAEPGTAPVPSVAPVGQVIPLPATSAPWGIVAAPQTSQVLVSLRDPGGLAVLDTRTRSLRVVDTPDSAEVRHLEVAGPGGPCC